MDLHRTDRDNYVIAIEVTPDDVIAKPEASFDGGLTYHDGIASGDDWTWLVAGPNFNAAAVGMTDDETIAVITEDMMPLVRLKDDPVVVVDRAPAINLWS